VRKAWTHATLELGLDVRQDAGEDRETFDAVDGTLTMNRRAGGDQIVGGVYLEATREIGRLLLSAGARADVWRTFEGHDDQGPIGAPPSETVDTGDRGGVTPSGRFAARWNLDDGGWLRGAAYSGFRPPTLNELFRPYRVANTVTLNNTALVPERLYGVEAGAGQDAARFGWSATAFYNRLDDPVTNVTLHDGPYDDPLAGYVPAGGFLLERENVGAVDALGLEFDGHVTLFRGWALRGAVSWTHSRVDGGEAAPQLTGLRPAETPAVAATASLDAPLARNVTLVVDARYEGRRFVDDLNTLALAGSAVANARVDWRVSRRVTLYLEAENLFDAEIEQDEATAGLFSYGPPRAVLVGLRLTGDDVARSSASATP
jgi:outer membrane receptor protein involved in Fe transport